MAPGPQIDTTIPDMASVLGTEEPEQDDFPRPMDLEELQHIVKAEVDDAIHFTDLEISPQRATATRYYKGDKFGDEQEGRSQVVSQDVHDAVIEILPSLLRVFFSAENVVEFSPRQPEDVPQAEQATDYVNYIIREDNPGFLTFHTAFKDCLIYKTGIIKYWWDVSDHVDTDEYSGVDDGALVLLSQDPGAEVEVLETHQDPDSGVTFYSVRVTKREKRSRLKFVAVPPEEFLIDRRATCVDDADLVAHRTSKTVHELLEMGFTHEEVENAGTDQSLTFNLEKVQRNPAGLVRMGQSSNPSLERIAYTELYMRVDFDGDGVAEMRRIICLGDQHKISRNERADERPFAVFPSDPEPHVFFGSSVADHLMDVQKIKSQILRLTLDSLAQSITNKAGVVEGQVNMDDVLNNEVGGVIRMRAPGMYQPYTTPFVGQDGLTMLNYLDQVRESRGFRKQVAGLDASILQSTTKKAVDAAVQASQQHVEMIARILAETGMKDLFRGILRTICRNQDKARVVRLRNQWVPVDPRAWDASMDVSVNVGLGTGTAEDKINMLSQVAQKQEQIILQLGPSNPLVNLTQYGNTLRKMVELYGFKDSSRFFSTPPPDWQPPAPAQPQADPQQQAALLLAQVEREKAQADSIQKAAELAFKRDQALMDDARERYRIESDERVRLFQIEAQTGQSAIKVQAEIDAANNDRNHEAQQKELDRQHQMTQAAMAPVQQQPDTDRDGM